MKFDVLKDKITKADARLNETILLCVTAAIVLVQRFLAGAYKPVMDDWFLYGDLYTKLSERIAKFAVPNEKFAIRPFAGIIDIFVNAPLFKHI